MMGTDSGRDRAAKIPRNRVDAFQRDVRVWYKAYARLNILVAVFVRLLRGVTMHARRGGTTSARNANSGQARRLPAPRLALAKGERHFRPECNGGTPSFVGFRQL